MEIDVEHKYNYVFFEEDSKMFSLKNTSHVWEKNLQSRIHDNNLL